MAAVSSTQIGVIRDIRALAGVIRPRTARTRMHGDVYGFDGREARRSREGRPTSAETPSNIDGYQRTLRNLCTCSKIIEARGN